MRETSGAAFWFPAGRKREHFDVIFLQKCHHWMVSNAILFSLKMGYMHGYNKLRKKRKRSQRAQT